MLCRSSIDIIGNKCIKKESRGRRPSTTTPTASKSRVGPCSRRKMAKRPPKTYTGRYTYSTGNGTMSTADFGTGRTATFAYDNHLQRLTSETMAGLYTKSLYLSRYLLHPHHDADRQRVLHRPLLRLVESHCKLHIRRDGGISPASPGAIRRRTISSARIPMTPRTSC